MLSANVFVFTKDLTLTIKIQLIDKIAFLMLDPYLVLIY